MSQSLIFPPKNKYQLDEILTLSGEKFKCLRCMHHLTNQRHNTFLLKHDGTRYYSFLFCESCGDKIKFTQENLVKRIEFPLGSDVTATLETHGIFKQEIKN